MPKDSRIANHAAGKTDLLLYNPDDLVIVEDEASALRDDRAKLPFRESLVLSMMVRGVLQPVIVRKNPETDTIEVVDGRQRVKAAREANKRLKKEGRDPIRVPATIKRCTPLDSIAMMLTTNEQREADTPMNRAKKLARFLDMGGTEDDAMTIMGGVSRATIKNLIALLDAPAAVRRAVESEQVSVSDGYKLAKLEPEEAKKKLEKLKSEAPRTPGKKRSKNAKKAREIVGGKKTSDGDVVKQIAAWIRATWNDETWGGSPAEMADRIERGEWRETKAMAAE